MDFNKTEQKVVLSGNSADYSIQVWNEKTIRVKVQKTNSNPIENPYSIDSQVEKSTVVFKHNETSNTAVLKTEIISCEINKAPFSLVFKNSNGDILNEDDPKFGIDWQGTEVCNYKKLQSNEKFLGLGEKTGNINKRGSAYSNWNTDYFAYPDTANELYSSIPFYIGTHNGLFYGIFLNSTFKTVFNFGASNDRYSYFSAEDGMLDYFFFSGESITEVVKEYSKLTGTIQLPPLWSLGLQQCRYSYYPDTEVLRIANTFREKQIPCDTIYFDIHYMEAYKVFTWDKERFSDPEAMLSELKSIGFKSVIIVDPGVKIEEGYSPYEEGIDKGLFVKYPDGKNYTAGVWPGDCHFPDYTKEETREWWASKFNELCDQGLDGFWNDMNEPASWGQWTPNLLRFSYEKNNVSHRQARNVYGMQMSRSTYDGAKSALDGKRPFILTRASFSGGQRFAAKWTGDNVASDENMLMGVRMISNLGLSGMPFSGYDVGGFCGEASPELFARWISIGAFSPLFRCHSMINTNSAEPWSFGEATTEISRNYVNLRYRLLPYIYSCFREASISGDPVQRALCLDFQDDEMVYSDAYQHQYMFGPSILICAVPSTEKISKIYLPEGQWYDLYNDQEFEGGHEYLVESPVERLPIFVKAGAIIPMQSLVQHTDEKPDGTLEIHVYSGTECSFDLYEDDGKSFDFEDGHFNLCNIHFDGEGIKKECLHESYISKFDKAQYFIHGSEQTSITINGSKEKLQTCTYKFVAEMSNFDPFESHSEVKDEIKELSCTKAL